MKRMESTTKMATGKMALLMWVQKIAIEYGIKVENFDKHFKDGRVLCAIVNYYFPDELDYELVKTENEEQILNNHKMAFDIAEIHNVFKILDPEDMLTPDRNSIMTYVASMNKEFKPLPKGVPKKQREQVMKESIQQNNEEFQTIKENILQNLLKVQNIPKSEVEVETKEENVDQGKEIQEEKGDLEIREERLQQEQKKQEREIKEKERLEQEQEQEKQNQKEEELKQEREELERKEKERLKEEQEKQESERKEKERLKEEQEKQESERKEKERLEQEQEQERQRQEEKLKQESQENERREKEMTQEREVLEKQDREREENERRERERKQETENTVQQKPEITSNGKQIEFHPQMVLVLVYLVIGYLVTGFVISNVLFSFYTYLTLALIFGVSKYFPNLNVIPTIISYPPYILRFLAYLDVELTQLCVFLKSLLISKGLLQVYQALVVVVSLITQVIHPVQDLLGITSGGFSLFIFFFPRLLGFVLGIFF